MKYMYHMDNREIKRVAVGLLKGRWGTAVLIVLIASLITGFGGIGSWKIDSDEAGFLNEIVPAAAVAISLFAAVYSVFVANVADYGFTTSFLRLGKEKILVFEDLFGGFRDYTRVLSMMFLKNLFIFLWSLLLIIPGIVKAYSYAMSEYILLENPETDALGAITKSREMMRGNKARLFMLDLSLIGWWILSVLTCGIGFLWLGAYYKTIHAVFYMDLNNPTLEETL